LTYENSPHELKFAPAWIDLSLMILFAPPQSHNSDPRLRNTHGSDAQSRHSTMKISSSILALALIQSANAFVVQPKSAVNSRHVLASTPEFSYGEGLGESSSAATPNEQGLTDAALQATSKPDRGKEEGKVDPVIVQGGSLRTWSFATPKIERVQVHLSTGGRPLNADVDLWQGPDNTPQKMAVYIEDGALRPFNAIVETPRGQNTIAVLNTASMEYPLSAMISAAGPDSEKIPENDGVIVQGGAIKTYSFGSAVGSVQIVLSTDGRPLNARLELLQGPNNNKQVIDLYTEDGLDRPFTAIIETPGSGNVIRIVNTATIEYPLTCAVDPYSVEPGFDDDEADGDWEKTNDASFFFLGGK
jgi:hypothetical protein